MSQPLYLIAGLGKTGYSIARYLQRSNLPFVAFDTRESAAESAEFCRQFPGVDVFLGQLPVSLYPQLTGIIASPGVPLDEPFLKRAVELGIPIYGDIECLAQQITAPVIAITGTNGKSTVTTLVGEMAMAAGLSTAVAGNIGTPVLDLLEDGVHYDIWVLELSSFQLDLTHSLKPQAAVILNITPDHLDRHHQFSAYVAAKQRVYRHAQFLIYNRDDEWTIPKESKATEISYGLDEPKEQEWGILPHQGEFYLAKGKQPLLAVSQLKLKGRHNWQNALAACALAEAAGISWASMQQVLTTFAGLPHRCQWVRHLEGVDWINDSKGTNVGATISAMAGLGEGMAGKIVLLAGGLGKGADFTELREAVEKHARALVLIGTDAPLMEQALGDLIPIFRANSMDEAVRVARNQALAGDVVLLSPACASFDMFRDFNHRGEIFTHLVEQL